MQATNDPEVELDDEQSLDSEIQDIEKKIKLQQKRLILKQKQEYLRSLDEALARDTQPDQGGKQPIVKDGQDRVKHPGQARQTQGRFGCQGSRFNYGFIANAKFEIKGRSAVGTDTQCFVDWYCQWNRSLG